MMGTTESAGGTTKPHVEVFVVQERRLRARDGARGARYFATVIPMDAGDDRWWPHVRIADDSGNLVKDAGSTGVRFPTRAAAEYAGWSFVEAWIRCQVDAPPLA